MAAGPSATTEDEIQYLLNAIGASRCEFLRNGQWHSASKAKTHLESKYRYLLKRGLVSTSEEFIDRAGSASSTTGKTYRIRCGKVPAVPSADWLFSQLRQYRQTKSGRDTR